MAFSYAGPKVVPFIKTGLVLVLNPIFEVYDGEAKSIKFSPRYDIDTFFGTVDT